MVGIDVHHLSNHLDPGSRPRPTKCGLRVDPKALVRQFVFDHGLLGANTKSVDDVAIRYPDASVQGKSDRVRLVFDASYMQAAAAGKL